MNDKQSKRIQTVQFAPLSEGVKSSNSSKELNSIEDVNLQLIVELGKTNMKVRDILKIKPGVIISVDKLAGEHVDVVINESAVAEAEVVVVDEKFAIRITDIVSKQEREERMND
ncbi:MULTISPECIES: flagellar motor switch protein FliN [Neobacillus]|jgi:flagellar motor switch protein FliN|uniref:flagellar motor switch protein FliN n=1 Tax=Neobacillus TaxID=2675232 RepID=UPI000BF6B47A|nr:flagellar motor switch protein FliN [Neobacillus sp. OS1-33]PEQ89547.1 flagellar motor switch protein FliN [Bacillus sp. AFS006103]WML24772.1 flagellar motor switch protein FliN [Neobacillus sp. OS1-33]